MGIETIEKFVVALGFDFDPEGLKDFNKRVGTVKDTVTALTKVVVGATTALFGMTVATTAVTDEQGKMANQIGISVGELDALQTAAQLSGESADSVASSLQQLSIRSSEASRGMGTGVEAFGLLGISATNSNGKLKDTTQLMLEVSGALQGLDKAKQIELADKLGLGSSIRLLQQGPKAIQEMIDEIKLLGVTTEEEAKISAEFQDSLTKVWKIIKRISATIATTLAPVFKKVTEQFIEWWKVNKDILKQKLPEWIEKTVRVLKLLAIAAGVFISMQLASIVATLIKNFKGLGLVLSAVNKKMLLIPTLIAIVIAAFLLLAEDAYTFFQGGESLIGVFIKKFPEFEKAILLVAAAFATVWDIVRLIGSGLKQLFDVISNLSFEGIKETFALLPGWFSAAITDMKAMFDGFITGLIEEFPEFGAAIQLTADIIKAVFDAIVTSIKLIGEGIGALVFYISQISFSGMMNFFDEFLAAIPGTISSLVSAFVGAGKTIVTSLMDSFKNMFSNLAGLASDALSNIRSGITSKITGGFKSLFGSDEEDEEDDDTQDVVGQFQKSVQGNPGLITALTPGVPLVQPVENAKSISQNTVNNTTSTENNKNNTNNQAGNKTTNISKIEIIIDGAKNPGDVAKELQRQLQQAAQDVNSGVYQ